MAGAFSFFELYNRFFDEGWPGRLRALESMVWLAMLKHADRETGQAWPGAKRIAGYVGHSKPVHIHVARASLIRQGLLARIRTGGGKTPPIFKILLPSTSTNSVTVTESETVTDSGATDTDSVASTSTDSGATDTDSVRQTDHRTTQGTTQQKGKAPAFDLGLLRDDLRASHEFVEVLSEWLASKPQSRVRLNANLRRIEKLTVAEAIDCVNYSLAGNYPALYPDWNKQNEKRPARRGGCYPENITIPILN